MSQRYRIVGRLAVDGKNIIVEHQWQIHDDQVGDHNWKTIDRFNTPSLSKVPSSKKWIEPIPPAQGICNDQECAEYNPHIHFMTDPRCINYKFNEAPQAESSGCLYCDHGDLVEVRYGKRQHAVTGYMGEDFAWVDCSNQPKLLTTGPNLDDFGIEIVPRITNSLLSNSHFIFTAILQTKTSCQCATCVIARDVVNGVLAEAI